MRSEWIPDEHLSSIVRSLSPRDKILTMLLLETGFRLDDVMHVRAWQMSRDTLTIKEMKTGKLRTMPISKELILAYKRAFPPSHRRGWTLSYAFPALRGGGKNKMHRTTYWRHFREASRRAGYGDHTYTPHSLRKVFAVRLCASSGIKAVMDSLGHEHITTTMLYAFANELQRDL